MSTSMIVRGAPENTPGSHLCIVSGDMADLVAALSDLGMVFECEPPDFPWEEFDNLEGDPRHYDAGGQPISPQARSLVDRVRQVRSAHGCSDIAGIPEHKFWVDEGYGWHVTKQECEDAVTIYDAAMADGEPHPEELEDNVIPFLRLAARYDGFTVE